MRLGIGTYTYTWAVGVPGSLPAKPMSGLELLDEAARLGVGLVQVCENLPLLRWSDSDLEAFQQRAQRLGLEIELGTRGLDPENLQANLRLALRFGCRFLRLVIDSPGDEPTAGEVVERLGRFLPNFEAAGVLLAIENHDRLPSGTLAWIVEQLGPERVGICLDTVNSLGCLEGPEVVVRNLARYALCLHIKDFTIRRVAHQMGFVVEGCAAGTGRLNVPWLLEALKASPHPFNAVLETWTPRGDSLEQTLRLERTWAEEGVRYLRGLILG
jgi:sugar phosphate isomerase/epimerase